MQFEKPNKLHLTHSEAAWLAQSSGGSDVSDALRMRAEQGRRNAVQAIVPPDTFTGIPLLLKTALRDDEMCERAIAAQKTLFAVEQTIGVTADNHELHTITINVSVPELTVIYQAALDARAVAKECVENFREGMNELVNHATPEDRLSPSDQENYEGWQTAVYFEDIQVTNGIIDGLAPHVGEASRQNT